VKRILKFIGRPLTGGSGRSCDRTGAGESPRRVTTHGREAVKKIMATLPAFFKRTEAPEAPQHAPETTRVPRARAERDPYALRALPHEDILLWCKKIDNSRLVREADPQSRGACWSVIGAACVVLLIVTSASVPYVGYTLAGYKLETLRSEERRLLEERRNLDLQEAALTSPARLDEIARQKHMVPPASGQVVRLDRKDGALAMAKPE
jgi:cell division protein FtsL